MTEFAEISTSWGLILDSSKFKKRSIVIGLTVYGVRLCVCLSVSISLERLNWSPRNFLYMSPVARVSLSSVTICYVLPVLLMTSQFAASGLMGDCRSKCDSFWTVEIFTRCCVRWGPSWEHLSSEFRSHIVGVGVRPRSNLTQILLLPKEYYGEVSRSKFQLAYGTPCLWPDFSDILTRNSLSWSSEIWHTYRECICKLSSKSDKKWRSYECSKFGDHKFLDTCVSEANIREL